MRPICQICGRTGHSALKCWNRFDNSYQSEDAFQALATIQVSDNSGLEWFPDSGASTHITSTTAPLTNYDPYNGSEAVMVADSAYLPITHVDSTSLTTHKGSLPLLDALEILRKSPDYSFLRVFG